MRPFMPGQSNWRTGCSFPRKCARNRGCSARPAGGPSAVDRLWRFLDDFEIAAFDEIQARLALSAFNRYGKGIHPRARLNLADCAAYALASSVSAPLVFKGGDFSATDVQACF